MMPDREKVIQRLNHLERYGAFSEDWKKALRDAIALLREQEPVVATWYQVDGVFGLEDGYKCGECNTEIEHEMRYCPYCGRRIKWNATD